MMCLHTRINYGKLPKICNLRDYVISRIGISYFAIELGSEICLFMPKKLF